MNNAICGLALVWLILLSGCAAAVRYDKSPSPVVVNENGDVIELNNGLIALRYDRPTGELSATHLKWNETLFTDAAIAPQSGAVSVVEVSDGDERGRAIRIDHPDGRSDWISLWRSSPTMYLKTSNRSAVSAQDDQAASVMTASLDFGAGPYVGYDSGADKFVLQSSYTLTAKLAPGESRLIGLRKVENQPLLLGATDQTAHRFAGVRRQRWNDSNQMLSGVCNVQANQPYELRILAAAWLRGEASVSAADQRAEVDIELVRSGPFNRVIIRSPAAREVAWSVHFK